MDNNDKMIETARELIELLKDLPSKEEIEARRKSSEADMKAFKEKMEENRREAEKQIADDLKATSEKWRRRAAFAETVSEIEYLVLDHFSGSKPKVAADILDKLNFLADFEYNIQ